MTLQQEEYVEGSKASGLQVGDEVIVTRVAVHYEKGWRNVWAPNMKECVGQIVTIVGSDEFGNGFRCRLHTNSRIRTYDYSWAFPYFVLKLVNQQSCICPYCRKPASMVNHLIRCNCPGGQAEKNIKLK